VLLVIVWFVFFRGGPVTNGTDIDADVDIDAGDALEEVDPGGAIEDVAPQQ
jgi:hypothetical protein